MTLLISNPAFITNCGRFCAHRVFYKSGKRALVAVGQVLRGSLKVADALEIGEGKFSIKRIEVNKLETNSANSGEVVGVQLEAKPSELRKLGVVVNF